MIGQRLARHHLELGIERGADRQAALVQRLLAVLFIDPAAHLFGEIFGREHVRTGRTRGDGERLFLGLLGIGRLDRAGDDHLLDHPVAALDCAVLLAERIVVVRRLRQRREIGRLRDRQLVHRLVEVEQRRRGHAVSAEAEIDFVEIELEDLFLGIGALDFQRQQRLLDLALERDLVGQKEVLGDLLGDRGRALRPAARSVGLHIEQAGANDAAEVEAVVLVEVLVLGGEEGVDHHLRHGLDRNVEPALRGVFGDQRTVAGMDAGHHRRLIVLQLRVVRQVLGEMPEQTGARANGHQEHDGPGREQKAAEAQQQSHCGIPICRILIRPEPPPASALRSGRAINPKLSTSFPRPSHVQETTAALYKFLGPRRKALSKPGNPSESPGFLCSN